MADQGKNKAMQKNSRFFTYNNILLFQEIENYS